MILPKTFNFSLKSPFDSQKLTKLWRNLIFTAAILAAIIICLIVADLLVISKADDHQSDIQNLQISNNHLQQQITAYQTELNDLIKAQKLWDQMKDKISHKNGLEIGNSYVFLNHLSQKYGLTSNPEVKLSPPYIINYSHTIPPINIMAASVKININAINDETILQFLGEFLTNIPGFTKIESLSLRRNSPITPTILNNISQGKKPDLVDCEIIFQWQDLINTPDNHYEIHDK